MGTTDAAEHRAAAAGTAAGHAVDDAWRCAPAFDAAIAGATTAHSTFYGRSAATAGCSRPTELEPDGATRRHDDTAATRPSPSDATDADAAAYGHGGASYASDVWTARWIRGLNHADARPLDVRPCYLRAGRWRNDACAPGAIFRGGHADADFQSCGWDAVPAKSTTGCPANGTAD